MLDDLIRRCAENDRSAQRQIYEHFFGKMLAVCRRYSANDDEAHEILNNGFLKVFQQIGQFQFKGSFEGWVRRIMINKALDYIRSNKTYKENMHFTEAIHHGAVDNEAFSNLNMEALYAMIQDLPRMSKAVFNLYAIEGYTHREIGDQLGISEGTSKWHMATARKTLQQVIKKNRIATMVSYEQ